MKTTEQEIMALQIENAKLEASVKTLEKTLEILDELLLKFGK